MRRRTLYKYAFNHHIDRRECTFIHYSFIICSSATEDCPVFVELVINDFEKMAAIIFIYLNESGGRADWIPNFRVKFEYICIIKALKFTSQK